MLKTFHLENSITPPPTLYFDIQRFATGTAIKISGVIKNVEVGDTFTVDGAKYTILTVEENSVTAIVEGTPATDFGKEIVISDNKSIEGATIETSETSDVDSEISTKYTYKLDIGGNSVFVTVYENAIESVKDSDGNSLSASGNNYTVGTINFALSLDNGIPNATYNGTSSVAAVLDTTTYSFSVDSKPVEVVVQNDAITKVSVDSAQVGTAAGTYSVGTQKLNLSYANGSLTAQNASSVSPTISSVATYKVGDTTVTVDSSGQLSQTTATVNGQTATLTYSADTKKITASYTVSMSGNSGTYAVTLPDDSTVTVKVENGAISSVTYNNNEITATDGKYSVITTGGTNYALSLSYADNNLTATATTTIDELASTQGYTVAFGDDSITITVKDSKLYQGDTELSATNDIYTVTVGSKTVKLTYDATNGLQVATNVVDLSTLTADYEAKDGDILTGTLGGNYKISIAAGATVTLSDVNINVTSIEAAGIACNGSATIILEGTNTVTGADNYAGIQAGGENTKLTIEGTGSLEATGGFNGAGIGSGYSGTSGAITINGGNVSSTGGNGGAGIGSGYSGTSGAITINGGNVSSTGDGGGAGIGSGNSGTSGAITINDGTITTTGGYSGAGIGSGYSGTSGAITINGGNVSSTGGSGGAGIGTAQEGTCSDIEIKGGTVTATGGDYGAGIGAGGSSTCGNITIDGGTVTATGSNWSAGIGTGQGNPSKCGNITITNNVTKVTATKGYYQATNIGKSNSNSSTGTITIKGDSTTYVNGYNDGAIFGDKVTDLSKLTAYYMAKDGKILTGKLGESYNLAIADGATVTLSNVTISGNNAAGITCLGSATIILEGTNTVTGAENFAGIQAGGENTTLTIKGTGSLTAKGGFGCAGIGSGNNGTFGDIEIKGGNVSSTGGDFGAGIGSGYTYEGNITCGNIEINGGTVKATGGSGGAGIGSGYTYKGNITCGAITISGDNVTANGGENAAGIGSGYANNGNSTCSDIEIKGGNVTATGGDNGAGIGSGSASTCGAITISGGTVTANGGNYGAGIGSGQNKDDATLSPCGNITITNTVTKVTATKGNSAGNSIYTSNGTVTIGGKTGAKTEDTYTYVPVADISTANMQTATINSTTITFTTDSTGAIKYKIGSGEETTATITNNTFTFKVGDKDVTATVADGKVKDLSYDTESDTLKIFTATYTVTLPDDLTVTVKIENGAISSVTYNNKEITATDGKYSVTTTGGTNYTLTLNYADSNLTATATATIDELTATQNYTVAFGDNSITITVKDSKLYQGTTELSATNDIYTVTVGSKEVKLTYDATNGLQTNVVDLSTLTADYEAKDGEILTGTLGGNYKISIAAGATVTLRDVTITGVDNSNYRWAGITCNGNATIILDGTNTVKGFYNEYPGIQAGGTGTTLTIKGTGSLTAQGGYYGSGIGNGYKKDPCGNIVIESGNITAKSGSEAGAGIGSGYESTCGNITISGGNITAEGDDCGSAGIGSGSYGTCGNITISGGTVIANSSYNGGAGIGSSINGTCGDITISGGNITAKGGDSDDARDCSGGAGIGSGGADGKCGDITISGGTVTANGGNGVYGDGGSVGIGSGFGGTCGNITITDTVTKVTATKGNFATNAIGTNNGTVTTPSGTGAQTDNYTYMGKNMTDLSTLTADYTAQDGDILTGNPGSYKISIADGATVTLSGVTINGNGASGITCNGNATIILEGTNTVTGASNYAGIQAGNKDTTLTIKGTGSLTAKGGKDGAGIGSNVVSYYFDEETGEDIYIDSTCGNIVIESGTVTATGGEYGAGIGSGGGSGGTNTCGAITINGGSVTAKGGNQAAGIGSGDGGYCTNICGAITISGGSVTATGGQYSAGIGSGASAGGSGGTNTCGAITINGGSVTAKGGDYAAGIGSGTTGSGSENKCGDIEIKDTVTKVTATKGSNAANSIGAGNFGSTGTVTIGGKTGAITEGTYTYVPVADISAANMQTATINGTTITFTTDSTGAIKYTVGNGEETTATITNNTFTFKVGDKDVTATVADGKVKDLSYDTATTTNLEPVTITYEQTATLYTFTVSGNDISVSVDSDGNITYNAQAVTDNKITVDGKEVTLTVSDNKITGASYLGEYSTVTDIKQVDVYKVTIDGQEVSCTFDANNQCTVKVGEKNYLVTKTADDVTVTSPAQAVGTEDSRAYLLAVGDGNYLISCTFDGSGNVSAVASDDTALSISGTTIKIGDYTINISGTKDNLITAATLKTTSESVEDVEVKQAFVLSGVKSTNGIIIADNVVTLTEANLNSQDVTLTGNGYTLALDKDYPVTTIAPHFEGMTYKSASSSDGYELSDDAKTISYVSETPATDLFTLIGVKSTDGITIANNVVTLTEGNLNSQDVTLTGNGYTLALDKSYSATTTGEHFEGMTYKSASSSEGYEISSDAKTISYVSETPATNLFTLTGVKSTDGITVADNVVTLTEANLNNQDVTITGDGYTLALDKEYPVTTIAPHFEGLTYKSESTSNGYEISNDAKSISCISGTTATDLFTLTGVKSTDGIIVSDNVVTLTEANLNNQDVTITGDGYILALDKEYPVTTIAPHFDGLTYKSASSSDGYELSDDAKSISYVSETTATNLFTLTGVKSTDGITVSDNVVTLTEANLNNQDVTITGDGYTLALDKEYPVTTIAPHFEGLTYKSESTSNGYELSNDAKSISCISGTTATDLFTLSGVKSTDGITVSDNVVTLTEANLNNQDVTIDGDGYTLALDKEYPVTTIAPHFEGLTYKSESTSNGYELSNDAKSISCILGTPATDLFTLTGVKSTDGIIVSGNVVTLTEANLNNQDVTIDGDGYTLALDKEYPVTTIAPHFEDLTYKSESMSGSYELSNNAKSINYVSGTTATNLFTLTGVKSTDGITVADNVVTLTEANLNNQDVTIAGDGYILALDKDYPTTTIAPHFEGLTYKSASMSGSYELSNNAKSINYVSGTPATNLFTLSGVKSTDGITVSDNVVTLTEANLNNQDVTIDGDGYTLALDKEYPATTIAPHFEGLTYKSESTSNGYELSNDAKSISCISGTAATDLFTLSGVKSTDGITISDNVVTLTETNLNNQDVTIAGDGYILALDKDYPTTTIAPHFEGLTYKSASMSGSYELSNNAKSINYVSGTPATNLFTLSGVKSTDGITVSDNVVMLTETNLNNQDVTIDGDGYTLALDKDYPVTTIAPHFDGLTYKSESTSNGYELSDDAKSISCISGTTATDLFTLTGVKSTDGITVADNVVTLTEANLNNQDVTIDGDGYTLALDKDYPVTTIAPHFEGLTYKSESTSNGYELSNDAKSISCILGTTATDLFTLSGVKSTDGITISDNVVTLTETNLNNQDVTIIGDGYTLSLAEGINEPTFNAGGWTLSGTTATYTSTSNSEGYTLSDDAKTVTYTSANDEDSSLKVYGVKSTTGLTLSGNVVTVAASSLNKQKVTISEGYTLAIADDVEQPSKKYKQWTQLDKDTYLYTGELTTAGYTLSDNEITYSEEIITGEQYSIKGAASTELISQGDDTEEVEERSLNRHKVILIETENHNSKNKLKFYGEDYARVTIGAGRDSFITYDGARTDADLTDADNVTIVSFGGEVALKNYDMEKGAVVLVQDVDDIVDAIKTNTIKLVGNEIQIDESSRVAINESNSKSTIVKLINYDGETQAVGFTGINGGTVNSSSSHENFLLKGNYAENSSDVQKNKPSNLISGNGHDTILAGARDFVDGGNGKNQIFLTPHDLRQTKDGATVVSDGKSRNTVQGFHEGFSYEDDVIQVDNFDNLQFKFDTDGLILNSDDARLKFDGIGTDNATSEDTTNKLGTNKAELIQLTNGSSNIFAAVAKNGQSILVQEDDYQTPTAFFGNRSGLNFSEYDRDVSVNLAEGTGKLNNLNATFHGINKLQAGDGMSTLIGDSNRNTLIAGNGYTSLRGGAGNDTLVGKGNSDDKEGWTNFFFMAGDERDVIKDFGFITPDNRDSATEDRINVEYTDVNNVYVFNDEVIIEFDKDDQLILEDARGKHFYINNLIAKADKNIAYDGITDRYVAGGGSNLTVDPTVDSAEIWLDNSHDTMFLGTPIRTLDASNVKGNTSLVGNEFNNTILAGQGDSKLWGGHSTSNDLLIGGNSRNTFFYCNGNGRDTIAGAHDGDVVILSDVTLEQISETSITADAVAINFKDGGSLQINSAANVNYQLADGSKYFANHEQATWIAKSTTT